MSARIAVEGVEHTGLLVKESEALGNWYTELFGATEVSRSGSEPPILFLAFGGGALLELVPASEERLSVPTDHVHLCFSVPSLDDALEALRDNGTPLDRPVFEAYDGSRVAFFRDPEGNLLQIVERVAGSDVHGAVFG
jgi:catechol 2,3-dioxygenase-like lactoylglutathione lyase family enzyme